MQGNDAFKEIETLRKEQMNSLLNESGLGKELNDCSALLDCISMNAFQFPKFISYEHIRLRKSYGIDASVNTLKGIEQLCLFGDFIDAYLLIRKLRDNLFLDLFIFEAIKSFDSVKSRNLTNDDLEDENLLTEKIYEYYRNCVEIEKNSPILKKINKWEKNDFINSKDKDRLSFDFTKYLEYLSKNNRAFSECYKMFLKNSFDKLNTLLNDYTHSNGESTLREKDDLLLKMCQIKSCVSQVIDLFVITLYFVDSTLFVSSDHTDALELGIEPPKESQYWIMPGVQEILSRIKLSNKELFEFMKNHNECGMFID